MSPSYAFLSAVAVAAPQSHEPQMLDIDGTVFVMLGIFLVAVFLLGQFLWKPYLRVRDERVTRVDGHRHDAARMDAESETRMARCQASMAEARKLGSQNLARARQEAELHEQKLVSQAQAQAQVDLAAARAKIEAAMVAEKATLLARATALGNEAAGRILGRQVTP